MGREERGKPDCPALINDLCPPKKGGAGEERKRMGGGRGLAQGEGEFPRKTAPGLPPMIQSVGFQEKDKRGGHAQPGVPMGRGWALLHSKSDFSIPISRGGRIWLKGPVTGGEKTWIGAGPSGQGGVHSTFRGDGGIGTGGEIGFRTILIGRSFFSGGGGGGGGPWGPKNTKNPVTERF